MRTPYHKPVNRIHWRQLIVLKDGRPVGRGSLYLKVLDQWYDMGESPPGFEVRVPVPSPWVVDCLDFPVEDEDKVAYLAKMKKRGEKLHVEDHATVQPARRGGNGTAVGGHAASALPAVPLQPARAAPEAPPGRKLRTPPSMRR